MAQVVGQRRIDAPERLIVALDLDTVDQARMLVEQLGGLVTTYKIGLRLQLALGIDDFLRELIRDGHDVFVDYKWLDVPETVTGAVAEAARLGVKFVTVHESGQAIRAAVAGRPTNSKLKILAVTVLTSLDQKDIEQMGFQCSLEELALLRAKHALDAGVDGVITSSHEATAIINLAHEAATIRGYEGKGLLIITPGIRPMGVDAHDQKRFATPAEAIRSGADYLVIGRPILQPGAGRDSYHAAKEILAEMQEAFDGLPAPTP